ncbi:uncharacterized protein LOC116436935 [Corvus moneduloides]|uniref:uncharacterized protein LOC116436935 n=1 Tax=Corvus moneduloides TaxID=1196302 RepID=UPI00136335E7|nr:uncharacterized protein LOC116436935 [Corvus moneduloides]
MAARAGPVPGLLLSCGFPLTQPGGRWERGAGLGRVQSPPLAPIGRRCRQSWFWRADWSERGAARARSRRQGGRGAAEAPLAERLCGPGSGGGGRSPVRRRRSSEAAPAQVSDSEWIERPLCPSGAASSRSRGALNVLKGSGAVGPWCAGSSESPDNPCPSGVDLLVLRVLLSVLAVSLWPAAGALIPWQGLFGWALPCRGGQCLCQVLVAAAVPWVLGPPWALRFIPGGL